MIIYSIIASNIAETLSLAELFVNKFLLAKINKKKYITIYLIGSLGVGKTTFMRGMLASLGVTQVVKSPTYTIVESYQILTTTIYHFDLYRLKEPKELELLGVRDYLVDNAICCFEWPDKGFGYIPDPDFSINLNIINNNLRKIDLNYYDEPFLNI